LAAFSLLALAGLGAIIVALSAGQAEKAVNHALQVREAEVLLFSTVQDAETGQRGYLLTGDISYLDPFKRAQESIPELKRTLSDLIENDPAQRRRLADLNADIDRKMLELERSISNVKAGDIAGALAIVKTNEGRDIMLRIRGKSAAFGRGEVETLYGRQSSAAFQQALLLSFIIAALLVAGLLAYFVGRETRRNAAELADRNKSLQREIVERGRAEAQLRQAQKMEALGQLTGGVAHDFNNMLAIIVGNLDIVVRKFSAENDRFRGMIDNALGAAIRAAALTKRLLAFSRLQPLEPRTTDVNKCVADMSEILRRTLGEHIAIETVLGGGLWSAFVDRPQLESAILNLAVNSRDAMPNGGRLTIETANASLDRAYAAENTEVEPGQYVLVAITDTGSGMTPQVLDKAFDPFFTTKKTGDGTGLGLSQVHGFLKQSHGHIKLYSEVGVGTTVKLYLPRGTGALMSETARSIGPSPLNERFTVLIVEDDPAVRSFVISATRELLFTTMEADSMAVALELLERHPEITVLLTDVVMPGGTGRQLADRAVSLRPDLRVIYMTGYTRNAIVHNGSLDPGTRLITKPFTLDDLHRELNEAIASL
jgi:signal transduction histidine kinase/CheY-like chemotaxis protein